MEIIRRFWQDLPLASKFAVFSSVLVLLIIPILTMLTIQRERKSYRYELEAQAVLLLDTLSERLRDPLSHVQIDEIVEIAQDIKGHAEITRFKVYNRNGILKVDAHQPDTDFPLDADPLKARTIAQVTDQTEFYWDGELVAEMGVWIEDERVGYVQMGFSTAPLNAKIRTLAIESFTLAALALMIGISLAILVSRQLTVPIRELTRTANKMAAGDLSIRLQPTGQAEIGQLGRAFNDMAEAIEKRETDLRALAHSLEKTVDERTQELQQQNQYLAALHEVTLGLIENLDVEKLLEAIMTRAAALANAEHAFVTIINPVRDEMQIRVAQGLYRSHLGFQAKVDEGLSGRVVATGDMVIEEDYQRFEGRHTDFDWLHTAIYVPLKSESAVLGVIGLGYSRVVPVNPNHVDILNQFAQLASLALVNAQLYTATQLELTETGRALMAEEERRKAYLTSPQGRAESLVEAILEKPEQALSVIYDLTQKAEQESHAMILLELPGVLEPKGLYLLARLAEGYQFIYRSNTEPELLTVGLRQLRTGLAMPEARSLWQADEGNAVYSFCQKAVEAGSIHSITELLPDFRALEMTAQVHRLFSGIMIGLQGLIPVAETLRAYERVETAEDRRDYLAMAVEWLTRVDRSSHALLAADRPIIRRLTENWMAIVTLGMSDLQTRAQISYRLLSRYSWKEEKMAVALQLRNEGHGIAFNLRVNLEQSPDYSLIDAQHVIDRLASGEEVQLEFRVHPGSEAENNQFRACFEILYDDPRGPNHTDYFADIVHLLAPAAAFQFIPNPYIVGTPLEAGSPLFFGREDLFGFIGENLTAEHQNNLVLIGQRRTGKSSFLKQLPLRLGEDYLPVYLDGQSIALDPGMPAFISNLALEIGFAVQERGFTISIPLVQQFIEQPTHTFEHDFLRQVHHVIGNRHILLLLDEFEELESAVKRGNLDASVFIFLRHLIQHHSWLSIIFVGTHRMEELAADYWSVLFNISLYKHVGFLEYAEAIRLIQEPVDTYGMCYDDLALDKIWRITAGHPYFLQLLCHSLVNQHNRLRRSYVTVSDVNSAVDEILSSGEAHFIYLWNESSREERLVLGALSRLITLTGHVIPAQLEDYLNERGISLGRSTILDTLHQLALRDILTVRVDSQVSGAVAAYGWRLGLLGLWIEKYTSLSLILEEPGQ